MLFWHRIDVKQTKGLRWTSISRRPLAVMSPQRIWPILAISQQSSVGVTYENAGGDGS
jgi:hypothetical protein